MRLRILSFALAVMLFLCCYGAGKGTYTVVVSLDGFRWDYPEAYDTPFFDRLAQEGVKAVMMPSFPTKTFPNHYTLATGLVPDHHGIIGNKFKNRATGKVYAIANRETRTDPSYYGGEPLWLTAKSQGVKSATIYWVGSDAPIQGQQADYWKDYNKGLLTMPQRVDEIIREAYEVGYKRQESGFAKSRLSALPANRLNNSSESYAVDFLWYLWCGKDSPLFDKDKMATFERSFLKNKSTQKEKKGAYYTFRNEPETVDRILDEFEVKGHHRHIINGHTPVHTAKGESPMKAGGKLLVIDGGFSKPYHRETGIAGYTLVYHSRGMQLVEHQPFLGTEDAIRQGTDIRSTRHLVEMRSHRLLIRDTDKGREIEARIDHLRRLLFAYREGLIK